MAEPWESAPEIPASSASPWESAPEVSPDLRALADSAADRHGVPRHLFRGLISTESAWDPNAVPKDAAGNLRSSAKGLTQLIDKTAADMGVSDPFDPLQNLEGGAKYLRAMHDQFGDWHTAIAAYHDGPGKVAAQGITDDTGAPYLASVLKHADEEQAAPDNTAASPLNPAASIAAFSAANTFLSPDDGADALNIGQQNGISAGAVAGALPAARGAQQQEQIATTLASAPVTAQFMAQSQAHAAAAKDDIDNLSFLEWTFLGLDRRIPAAQLTPAQIAYAKANGLDPAKAFTENVIPSWIAQGIFRGIFGLRAALLGLKAGLSDLGIGGPQLASVSPEALAYARANGLDPRSFTQSRPLAPLTTRDQQNLVEAKEVAERPIAGGKESIGRLMVTTSAEAIPQLAGFLGGAAGSAAFLFAQTYGQLHNQLGDQKKADGLTPKYTEAEVRGLASAGAVATTALLAGLGAKFVKGVSKVLPAATRDAIGKAGADALVKRLVESPRLLENAGGRALQLGQHALNGVGFMVGQGLVNDLTDQAGEVLTGGRYDASKTVQRAKQSVEGALMIAPIMVAAPLIGFTSDVGRAWKSRADAVSVAAQIAAAKDSKLVARAPEQAQALLERQASGSRNSTAYIPVAAFDKAMREAGVDPREGAAQLVGDDGSAHQEATASGGDLAVPMAALLRYAPQGYADALLPDIKLDPDGMTPRDSEAARPALNATLADMREGLTVDEARALYDAIPPDEQISLTLPIASDLTPAQLKAYERAAGKDFGAATTPGKGQRTPERAAAAETPPAAQKPADAQAQAVFETERQKMLDAGRPEDEAQAFATLRAQIAVANAKRYGGTAQEWYERLGELRMVNGGEATGADLLQRGEIRAILRELPPGATMDDLRARLESEAAPVGATEAERGEAARVGVGAVRDFLARLAPDATIDEVRRWLAGEAPAGALFQGGPVAAPPWYSALERAAESAKQAKGTPDSWLAVLSKTAGVKAEEIRETGVDKWLGEQKGTVTREQVADFIRQHRVELQEKVLGSGGPEQDRFNDAAKDFESAARRAGLTPEESDDAVLAILNGDKWAPPADMMPELAAAGRALRAAYEARADAPDDLHDPKTHYEDYTTGVHKPGTYRELLLTSPAARDFNAPHFGEDSQGIIAHARIGETTDAQGRRVLMVEEIQSDLHQQGRTEGYTDKTRAAALQEEMVAARKNVQAWLGEDDHAYDIRRAAGTSLWSPVSIHGQWGRSFGTREEALQAAKESDAYRHRHGTVSMNDLKTLGAPKEIIDAAGEALRAEAEMSKETLDRKSPDVPWKDTWEELMVRRLVRYAAEHGFDRIALTPGAVHTGRYGTEQIVWAKGDKPGEWRVNVSSQKGGNAGGINIEEEAARRGLLKQSSTVITDKGELVSAFADADFDHEKAEHVADKIWDRMQKEDSGVSRPRAEGFEQAYDKRLKGAFDKQLKKYGGKMEMEPVSDQPPLSPPEMEDLTNRIGQAFLEEDNAAHARNEFMDKVAERQPGLRFLEVATKAERDAYQRLNAAAAEAVEKRRTLEQQAARAVLSVHMADLPAALRDKVLAEGQPLFQRAPFAVSTGGERGFITFDTGRGEPLKATLHFLEAADPSTAIHELGHFMLEGLSRIAEQPDAPPALKADYEQAVRDLGYASPEARAAENAERTQLAAKADRTPEEQQRLTDLTAKEEAFAHLFERYLAEGKAPSPALASVFARFKEWLKAIYGSVRAIGAQYKAHFGRPLKMSPQMRSFFDRLLAGEDRTVQPQPPKLAEASARAKEARDTDLAFSAFAADRIAKLPIDQIKPWVYERQAQQHAVKMLDLARRLETARAGIAATKVLTPQNHAGEPATYKLVEAADLVSSHNPETFAPDARYPAGVQERDYQTERGEQAKVLLGAQNLNPALVLSDTPTAVDGPPLVTSGATPIVLGGNGRSMMIRRAYSDGAAGAAYKEALREKAPAFGLDQAAVDAMQQPVLVRSLNALPSEAPKPELIGAVRRFNEGLTQQLSPRLRAVAEARVLSPQTIGAIGDMLGDESVRELLRSRPREVLQVLERDGVVNDQNRAQWTTGGELTDEAKDRIEGMFLGRVVGSGERLAATAPSLQKKLERAAPSLIRVEGANPALSEIGDVQGALDLLNDAGRRGQPLEDLLGQGSMFDKGTVAPRTAAMARLFAESTGKDIERRFRAWADAAAREPGAVAQGSMFESAAPPSAADALKQLFAGRADDLSGEPRPADNAAAAAPSETAPVPVEQAAQQLRAAKVEPQAVARAVATVLRETQEQHLVSDHLAQAAARAQEQAQKISEALANMAEEPVRVEFARGGREFLDAYDALMGSLGIRDATPSANIDGVVARVGIADVGFDPGAIKALLGKPFDRLTVDEATSVRDALRSIRKAAHDAVEVEIGGRRQAIADVNARVRATLESRLRGGGGDEGMSALMTPPGPKGAKAKGKSILTELTQPQELLRRLGLDDLYHRDFIDARNAREGFFKEMGDYFQEHYVDAMPKEMKEHRFDPVDGPGGKFAGKIDRQMLWELGSWMGSESSAERAAKGLGVTEAQIHQALEQLSKPEWDFIQSRWDFSDNVVWPKIAAHVAEKVGLPPPKIEARPVTTKYGTYRGGYHPARYRLDLGREQGAAVAEGVADAWGDLRKGFPEASSYFTKARAQKYFDVPDLQWNAFTSHLQAVAHYLAMDKFVTNMGRLLRNQEFRQLVRDGLGQPSLEQLDEFHKVSARGMVEEAKGGAKEAANLFGGGILRSRVGTAAFQLNLKVVLGQLSHLLAAMPALKIRPDHMARGVFAALRPGTYEEAFANSKQLPYRWNDYGKKTREMLQGIGPETRSTGGQWVDVAGWSLYHFMDGFLSRAIHEAAKLKALDEGSTKAAAYEAADKAVSRIMPPRNIMEQSSFARDRGVLGSMLLVRNFPNTIFNVSAMQAWDAATAVHDAAPGWQRAKAFAGGTAVAAGSLLGTYLAIHIAGRYLMGHGKEHDESHERWLFREGLTAPLYQFGPLEDAADPFIRALVSKHDLRYQIAHGHAGLRAAPVVEFFDQSIKDIADLQSHSASKEKRAFAGLRLFSRLAGGPTAMLPSIQYGYDLATGKQSPHDPLDLAGGLLYGKRPKQARNPLSDLSHLTR